MGKSAESVFERPDSKFWYAWVPDPRTGKSVARSTKCRTQGEAVAWRRRYIKSDQDPAGEAARGVTLEAVLNAFLESRGEKRTSKGKPLSENTREFYQQKASMVGAVLGASTLASKLTASTIDNYITVRRKMPARRDENGKARTSKLVSDHTIAKELAVLRAALTLAKRRGKWSGDVPSLFPAKGDFSAGYDPKKAAERVLSRTDVAKLMATTKPATFAVMAFAIATSAEFAALKSARRSDVSPDRSVVRVRGTKNERRDREVPITTLEQMWLLEFALEHASGSGELLFPSLSNLTRDFKLAAKAAGVPHFSPHNCRHTLAKWLTAGGVHAAVVGSVLGHVDGSMVERTYGHLRRADDVRSALEAQYRAHAPQEGADSAEALRRARRTDQKIAPGTATREANAPKFIPSEIDSASQRAFADVPTTSTGSLNGREANVTPHATPPTTSAAPTPIAAPPNTAQPVLAITMNGTAPKHDQTVGFLCGKRVEDGDDGDDDETTCIPEVAVIAATSGDHAVGRAGLEPATYGLKAPSGHEANQDVIRAHNQLVTSKAILQHIAAGNAGQALSLAVTLAESILAAEACASLLCNAGS